MKEPWLYYENFSLQFCILNKALLEPIFIYKETNELRGVGIRKEDSRDENPQFSTRTRDRTGMDCSNGVWDRRVYRFRHSGFCVYVCGGWGLWRQVKNLCPRPVNGVMTWTGTKVGIFFISGNRQIVFLGKKNPFPRLSVMVLQPLRPKDLRFRNQ